MYLTHIIIKTDYLNFVEYRIYVTKITYSLLSLDLKSLVKKNQQF